MSTLPPPQGGAERPPSARASASAASAAAVAEARRARLIAVGAILIAAVAVGLVAWQSLAPTAGSCQSTAWDAAPPAEDLPAGWSIGALQYGAGQVTTTLVGPPPADELSAQAVAYATITCYAQGASEALSRSLAAAAGAGQEVDRRDDLGDEAYAAIESSGASYVTFRHGDVVADIAASGDTTGAELEAIVAAIDRALGGDGPSEAIATPEPVGEATSGPTIGPSDGTTELPTEAPVSPELEAALPGSVAGTPLAIESATGTTVLGDDAGSRAVIAALRAEGASPEDLQVAQAYDENGTLDLSVIGFRAPGLDGSALRSIVLDTWLAADGPGVSTREDSMGGRTFTIVDFGDGGSLDYLTVDDDIVILIETSDAELAAQAAAALP